MDNSTVLTGAEPASALESGEVSAVKVWLFGALATVTDERTVTVELPAGGTVDDVLAALVQRLGAEFAALALGAEGMLAPCCRLFVDGRPVEDVAAPITGTEVEIILLTSAEGG